MKYFKYLLILFVCFLIVGCGPTIKEKDRDNVIRQLEKLDYIPDDWELVKEDAYSSWSLEWSEIYSYDYVMKDKDDVYHVVSILTHESKPKENIFEINIYDDVIFIDRDKYDDGEKTYEFPYSIKEIILEKKGLKWVAEVKNEKTNTYRVIEVSKTLSNDDELDYSIENNDVVNIVSIEKIPNSSGDKTQYKVVFRSNGEGESTVRLFAKGKEEETFTEYKFVVNSRYDMKNR